MIDEPKVLQNIKKIRAKLKGTDREDHLDEIEQWEKDAKKAILVANLQDHEGIKILSTNIALEIASLNTRLTTEKSDTLPETTRDVIIDVRDYMVWFLGFFADAQRSLKEVEETVENQLEEDDED